MTALTLARAQLQTENEYSVEADVSIFHVHLTETVLRVKLPISQQSWTYTNESKSELEKLLDETYSKACDKKPLHYLITGIKRERP